MAKPTEFKVGDKVKHSAGFLRQVHANKDIADMRGEVIAVKPVKMGKATQIVRIAWVTCSEPSSALNTNIALAGKFEPFE